MGAHPLFSTLSRRGLNPIKLAYSPSPPDNGLGQYVSSPCNRAYCYAELAVSSLAMAVIIASTHFAYPRRDGQAELATYTGRNITIVLWYTRHIGRHHHNWSKQQQQQQQHCIDRHSNTIQHTPYNSTYTGWFKLKYTNTKITISVYCVRIFLHQIFLIYLAHNTS